MIKSKRKTTIYTKKITKATYSVDSNHNWHYRGSSPTLGDKFKSDNFFTVKNDFATNKLYRKLSDINDV